MSQPDAREVIARSISFWEMDSPEPWDALHEEDRRWYREQADLIIAGLAEVGMVICTQGAEFQIGTEYVGHWTRAWNPVTP